MAFSIKTYHYDNCDEVVNLWRQCGLVTETNNPYQDIQIKCTLKDDLFFVGILNNIVVASVMAGFEGHRGWINYLAVSPPYQGQGYAKALVDHVEKKLKALGCPKINLQVRASNQKVIGFYESLGYKIDEVISLGKRI